MSSQQSDASTVVCMSTLNYMVSNDSNLFRNTAHRGNSLLVVKNDDTRLRTLPSFDESRRVLVMLKNLQVDVSQIDCDCMGCALTSSFPTLGGTGRLA